MIISLGQGHVLAGPEKHVVFPITEEGLNNTGFVGNLTRNFWPDLSRTKPSTMGSHLAREVGVKVLHAVTLYSCRHGWQAPADYITSAFDALPIPHEEPVAAIDIGGPQLDFLAEEPSPIISALIRARTPIVLYTSVVHQQLGYPGFGGIQRNKEGDVFPEA